MGVRLDFIQSFRTEILSQIACNAQQETSAPSHQHNHWHVRLELILQEAASLRDPAAQNANREHFAMLDP